MKRINKKLSLIFISFLLCLVISSCKTDSWVNFESEEYNIFLTGDYNNKKFPDDFYYSRIMTVVNVDIIIRKFSSNKEIFDCQEIKVAQLELSDDRGNTIYFCKEKNLGAYTSSESDTKNNLFYKIYSFKVPEEELSRNELIKSKSQYLMMTYEIDGVKYSEKLIRDEKKYFITRT